MKDFYQENKRCPLYKGLADLISKDILARGLKNGDYYCTMKSLCQEFNASFITVRKSVTLLEQQGIIICRSAVGIYIQDINKLKVLNSFEKVILILSSHPLANMHPFYAARLLSMINVLTREGFLPRVCDFGEINSGGFETQLSLADGIISSSGYGEMLLNADARVRQLPKVCFSIAGQNASEKNRTSFIACDEDSLDDLCLKYMDQQPLQRIVYIHKASSCVPRKLQNALKGRLTEYKYPPEPSIGCGKKVAPDILNFPPDTFFLVDDDYVAVGIYQTALSHGINLIRGKRILVTASPAFEFTEQMGFPIVGFDPNHIGILAADTLVQMIKNPGQVFSRTVTASQNKNAI